MAPKTKAISTQINKVFSSQTILEQQNEQLTPKEHELDINMVAKIEGSKEYSVREQIVGMATVLLGGFVFSAASARFLKQFYTIYSVGRNNNTFFFLVDLT